MRAVWLVVAALAVGCRGHEEHGHGEHEHGPEETGHGAGEKGHGAGEKGHGAHDAHDEPGVVTLSAEAAARTQIRLAPVERRALPATVRTTARVAYDDGRVAHVSPRIAGRVRTVAAGLGQVVKAGEVLATIDAIELGQAKADYLSARSDEDLARKTLAREERLFKDKISSEQAVIEARAAHTKAGTARRAVTERLRLLGLDDFAIGKLRYGDPQAPIYPLLAPIDGQVVDRHLAVGEQVTPDETVFTVADPSHLWLWVDVFERDLARVHVGDRARVVTTAWPDRVFEGELSYIGAAVDPDTRAIRARIDLDNPDGALKPGMFAEVTISDPHAADGQSAREATVVAPAAALQRDGSGWIAFVADGERRYVRRVVEPGERGGEFVEIRRGLEPGEQVVVDGAFVLKSAAARETMGGGHSH